MTSIRYFSERLKIKIKKILGLFFSKYFFSGLRLKLPLSRGVKKKTKKNVRTDLPALTTWLFSLTFYTQFLVTSKISSAHWSSMFSG